MKSFELFLMPDQDIPAILSEALRECESLKTSRRRWARIVEALGVELYFHHYHRRGVGEVQPSLQDAAFNVTADAVPIQGEIHPRRARISTWDRGEGGEGLVMETPQGVYITLEPAYGGLKVMVDFGRDSHQLASLMLAGFAHRCPAAVPLASQAFSQWAASLK